MKNKEFPSSLDAALGQIDPERRRLLGILLAGAAALPLLNSTSLSAEQKHDKSADKSTDKSAVKHGPLDYDKSSPTAIKSDAQIKSSSNVKAMTWTKGGATANDDARVKTSAPIKTSNDAIELKTQGKAMKSSSAPIKSTTKPQ
ncbi:MAG: hypothetical protein ABSD70_10915 [Terracidiphilus sp.]|jgi:hypothetical protein